jgi:hypothetical protein
MRFTRAPPVEPADEELKGEARAKDRAVTALIFSDPRDVDSIRDRDYDGSSLPYGKGTTLAKSIGKTGHTG